jgi:hypothetical protein
MSAPYHITARDMAAALLLQPRAKQDVRVIIANHTHGRFMDGIVLVVPHGAETGEYYAVRSERALEALQQGATPEYLELEPYRLTDDAPEYPGEDRACSAADREYQFAREQV